jgi:hypothetical protein
MNDNYKIPQPEGTSELREPAVAYGTAAITKADRLAASILGRPEAEEEDADFWDPLDDGPPTAPDGRAWEDWRWDNDPEFRESIIRRFEETEAHIAAGIPGHTTDEVCDRILRCIETGNWDYYGLRPK